jgi:deoxyribodipyrimidine photo-lyase
VQRADSQLSQRMVDLLDALQATALFYNVQHEVNEARRDKRILDLLKARNIAAHASESQLILPPGVIRTQDDRPYTVYTPFKNKWIQYAYRNPAVWKPLPAPPAQQQAPPAAALALAKQHASIPESLPEFPVPEPLKTTARNDWPAGEAYALKRLERYLTLKGKEYFNTRDYLFMEDGTSRISTYLSLGIVSPRLCVDMAMKLNNNSLEAGSKGLSHWISEILWREFYKNILIEFPRVCMNQPFKPETKLIKWNDDRKAFEAWCQGKTGYPVVDASMRCLNATGFMHNRARMIAVRFTSLSHPCVRQHQDWLDHGPCPFACNSY